MFCGNCGTPNNDSSAFCANCGARLQAAPTPPPVMDLAPGFTPAAHPAPAPKRSKKGLFIALGSAAAATLAIVLVVLLCFRGPKATVKKYFNAVADGNAKAIMKLFPEKVLEEEIGDKFDQQEYIDELNEDAKDRELYGYALEFKILDVEDVDRDVEEYCAAYYEHYYDLTVKDIKVVTVKITWYSYGESSTDTEEIFVVKIGGKWYMHDEYLP